MLDPKIATAIEQLDYRVTVGDVAAQSGLNIQRAQSGLLSLASDVSAHLQVAESGEIAYVFPRNYRSILRSKDFRLRLQELWQQVWNVLFYLIRISFGIFLLLSILLIFVTIALVAMAYSSSQDDDRGWSGSRSGGGFFFPNFWLGSDLWWWLSPSPRYQRSRLRHSPKSGSSLNFFEAIFSYLFGDGDPNADLEDQRWRQIGAVIKKNQGAVVAEQIMPFFELEPVLTNEDFMIPVLSKFNGYPEVTEEGGIIYRFPELQTTASDRASINVSSLLKEDLWQFSQAGSGQIAVAIGLGVLNLFGAVYLASILQNGAIAAQLGGLVAFVSSILWLLLAYGIGFLGIPLIRYFWLQYQNKKIAARNTNRQRYAIALQRPSTELNLKLEKAKEYRNQVVLSQEKLAYTTEKDLIEQDFDRFEG